MKRKIPTILILAVLAAMVGVYWLDMTLFIDPASGFVETGSIWHRYALLVVPVGLALAGSRTLGSRAIATFRLKNPVLGALMMAAAVSGVTMGGMGMYYGYNPFSTYRLILSFLYAWYGGWMFLAGVQMFTQKRASPTTNVFWGIVAAMPYCVQTAYRVLVDPSSLYRLSSQVRTFAALVTMLWMGMLLRALYIALLRTRVRDIYIMGMFVFLLNAMEFAQTIYALPSGKVTPLDFMEAVNMGFVALIAAGVSLSLSGQTYAEPPKPLPMQDFPDRLAGTAPPARPEELETLPPSMRRPAHHARRRNGR